LGLNGFLSVSEKNVDLSNQDKTADERWRDKEPRYVRCGFHRKMREKSEMLLMGCALDESTETKKIGAIKSDGT
jgi:hypothetical protein